MEAKQAEVNPPRIVVLRKEIELKLAQGLEHDFFLQQLQLELGQYYTDPEFQKTVYSEDLINDYLKCGMQIAFNWIIGHSRKEEFCSRIDELVRDNPKLAKKFRLDKEYHLKAVEDFAKRKSQYIEDNSQYCAFDKTKISIYLQDYLAGIHEAQKSILQAAKEEPVTLSEHLKSIHFGFDSLIDLFLFYQREVQEPQNLFIAALINQLKVGADPVVNIVNRIIRLKLITAILGEPKTINEYSKKVIESKTINYLEKDEDVSALLNHFPIQCYLQIAKYLYLESFELNVLSQEFPRLVEMQTICARESNSSIEKITIDFYLASLSKDLHKLAVMLIETTSEALPLLLREIEILTDVVQYHKDFGFENCTIVISDSSLKDTDLANANKFTRFVNNRKDFYKDILDHEGIKTIKGYDELLRKMDAMFKVYRFPPLIPPATGIRAYIPSVSFPTVSLPDLSRVPGAGLVAKGAAFVTPYVAPHVNQFRERFFNKPAAEVALRDLALTGDKQQDVAEDDLSLAHPDRPANP